MTAQHGGKRTPHNPAPASGPGKLSKRTDGGPGQKIMVGTDGAYGDRSELINQEKGAAMAQSPATPTMPVAADSGGGAPAGAPYAGGNFNDPSTQPDVPITHGVDIGPGAGSEAIAPGPQAPRPNGQLTNMLAGMSATDTTGTLAKLYEMAKQRGV